MPFHNVVSWNGLLAGHCQSAHALEAKALFDLMPERNIISWSPLILGYAEKGHIEFAEIFFRKMPSHDVVSSICHVDSVWTRRILVLGGSQAHLRLLVPEERRAVDGDYGRKSRASKRVLPPDAWTQPRVAPSPRKADREKPRKFSISNIVSWNTVIVAAEKANDAREVMSRMPQHSVVCTAMIVALSKHKLTSQAREVFDSMPEKNVVSWTALLQAYALGMDVDNALSLFLEMPERNLISWNSMLGACAQSGHVKLAMEIFHCMLLDGNCRPSEVSFMLVLGACSHAGMLEESRVYFTSMVVDHGVEYGKEHYWLMIDALARAGQLSKAEELTRTMPFECDAAQYEVLLGAAAVHRNAQVGSRAAERIVAIDPSNSSPYVLLANIHASAGNREEVAALWSSMQNKGVKTAPGLSLLTCG